MTPAIDGALELVSRLRQERKARGLGAYAFVGRHQDEPAAVCARSAAQRARGGGLRPLFFGERAALHLRRGQRFRVLWWAFVGLASLGIAFPRRLDGAERALDPVPKWMTEEDLLRAAWMQADCRARPRGVSALP